MLTSLRFKNWRSLHDVEIKDLTPITVFVGANSSGKTNIFDGLRFMRSALRSDPMDVAFTWRGAPTLHTHNTPFSDSTDIGIVTSAIPELNQGRPFSYKLFLKFEEGKSLPLTGSGYIRDQLGSEEESERISKLLSERWQMLGEDFLPPTSVPASELVDLSIRTIDRKARNVPVMLDFMRTYTPDVFTKLNEDLGWLLDHVEKVHTISDERETRFSINEKLLPEIEAPTISGGTSRAIAMLTAMYALEAFDPELPGLVAIEEPDTAIHPLLLDSLVELFRVYVDVDENGVYEGDGTNRRQIFLTTHNPRLLDYFKPEEVRLVERDENGFTVVKPVPVEMAKIWLDEYGLGTAWVTRALGGVPD